MYRREGQEKCDVCFAIDVNSYCEYAISILLCFLSLLDSATELAGVHTTKLPTNVNFPSSSSDGHMLLKLNRKFRVSALNCCLASGVATNQRWNGCDN